MKGDSNAQVKARPILSLEFAVQKKKKVQSLFWHMALNPLWICKGVRLNASKKCKYYLLHQFFGRHSMN